ncbi:MAG: hypothetical protein IPJ65_03305 [Archangiaceae bacterium]|nr:hypothetical protein [Archangiaceae bacterium]
MMKLLEWDEAVFRDSYDRQPFKLRHTLGEHPAFNLKNLRALALRLPKGDVLHRTGEVPLDANYDALHLEHANGLSVEETFDRLQEVNGHITLQNPERDPWFKLLVDGVMSELSARDGGIYWFATYLTIAAPGSITPYHMDRELSFQLQLEGKQELSVWDSADRQVMSELERERLFTDFDGPRPQWRDDLFLTEQRFSLEAGEGLHQPFIAPHLIRTGDEPSISWAVTFRTRRTDDRAAVHKVNHWLRRAGVDPTIEGANPTVDLVKGLSMQLYRALRRPQDRVSPHQLKRAA